jgi:tRNA (cytidine56-2'-O)-methyltransferase
MISVLRIGHRISRDKRITTHVALVARAFGADNIFIDTKDIKIEDTINSICTRFGGPFKVKSGVDVKKLLREWNGTIVHLTMYGGELSKSLKKIKREKDLLVIVGAEKVGPQIYEKADYNISIGNQPHSEVSALSIFLDRFLNGVWQKKRFNGKIEILPSDKGKLVISKESKD